MIHPSSFVHESSYVDEGVSIGEGTKIWHFTHVSGNAKIGQNCSIGQNVYIGNGVVIGNNVKIQNNVSVYAGVTLDDDVFCGPSMVFTNVHNPRSEVNRKSEFKTTHVGKGATLGANCTIVCGNDVGPYTFVGAGSVVTATTPEFSLFYGVPARQKGWVSRYGDRIPFGPEESGEWICPHMGDIYRLKGQSVELHV